MSFNVEAAHLKELIATFGGKSLTLKQVPIEGYTLESFMAIGTGLDTNLSFTIGDGQGFFLLDDISVTNVPEPASWALVGVALLGAGGILRGRKLRSGH